MLDDFKMRGPERKMRRDVKRINEHKQLKIAPQLAKKDFLKNQETFFCGVLSRIRTKRTRPREGYWVFAIFSMNNPG